MDEVMKGYDERQALCNYKAGFEAFLLGLGLCTSMMILMMFGFHFEDDADVCNMIFLILIGFYILRCLQQDAFYQITMQNAYQYQYVLGAIFIVLGISIIGLVLWNVKFFVQHHVISSDALMLIIGLVATTQGIYMLAKAKALRKEGDVDVSAR